MKWGVAVFAANSLLLAAGFPSWQMGQLEQALKEGDGDDALASLRFVNPNAEVCVQDGPPEFASAPFLCVVPRSWFPSVCQMRSPVITRAAAMRPPDGARVVAYLLKHGAKVNAKNYYGRTALDEAIDAGDADTVRLLVAQGATVEGRMLGWSISNSTLPVVAFFLDRGANVEGREGNNGDTPLMLAAIRGNLAMTTLLLERGARPDARNTRSGNTPLHYALGFNYGGKNDAIIRLLCQHGASLTAKNKHEIRPLDYVALVRDYHDLHRVLASPGWAGPPLGYPAPP